MRVVCYECPECGDQAHTVFVDADIACNDCQISMGRMGAVGVVTGVADDKVPKRDLETLIEEWQKYKDNCGHATPKSAAYYRRINDLEALLDDE